MWHVAVVGCSELEVEGIRSDLRSDAEVFGLDFESLLDLLADHVPDIILLNAELLCDKPSLFNFQIKSRYPDTKVILLLSQVDEEIEINALKASVDGCIIRAQPSLLSKAVEIVSSGGLFFRRAILEKVIRSLSFHNQFSNLSQLSNQEQKVLELVKMGKTNKDIAETLHISTETVKTRIRKIRRKLNLTNRRQLIYDFILLRIAHHIHHPHLVNCFHHAYIYLRLTKITL